MPKADDDFTYRTIRALEEKQAALVKVLKRYQHCRHGSVNCFCAKEAREVLALMDQLDFSAVAKERTDG